MPRKSRSRSRRSGHKSRPKSRSTTNRRKTKRNMSSRSRSRRQRSRSSKQKPKKISSKSKSLSFHRSWEGAILDGKTGKNIEDDTYYMLLEKHKMTPAFEGRYTKDEKAPICEKVSGLFNKIQKEKCGMERSKKIFPRHHGGVLRARQRGIKRYYRGMKCKNIRKKLDDFECKD